MNEIVAHKREEIKKIIPLEEKLRAAALLRDDFRSFERALNVGPDQLALIAEVKKASPTAGIIAEDFNPLVQAQIYDEAGASAISVLTDEKFFQGSLSYLSLISKAVSIPVLRKDFIIHPAQIYEAVVAGADAILLIVACLTQKELVSLLGIAHACQLDVLVEVHDAEELDRALDTEARIIGVNNRNLKTFQVDLQTSVDLSEEIPDGLIFVSESGIKTQKDSQRVFDAGANAILVGEALMRSGDVPAQVQTLTQVQIKAA
ncbi:MAG: indole-3-glycerol phosphate synthase TrpC [Verrucomicrobiales bacterium]